MRALLPTEEVEGELGQDGRESDGLWIFGIAWYCLLNGINTQYLIIIFSGRDASRATIHNVFEDGVVVRIAKAHGKTPAQVLLRHQVQQGIVVIPKSAKKSRIQQNFDVFDFTLTDQEMKDLDGQDRGPGCRSFFANFMEWDRKIESVKDYPWGENSGDLY